MSAEKFLAQEFDFTGRAICVTGAASGIGRATAALFASLGGMVMAADRDEVGLRTLAEEHPNAIQTCLYDQEDLGSIERLAATLGTVDVLANNAGALLYEPLIDLQWDKLERIVATNLIGAIALTKLVGTRMVQRGAGVIVHTGSQVAFNGAEHRSVYAATKAGISQFVKTAALEWGPHGVRVNCVAPGRTLTALNRHLLMDPADRERAVARIPLGRLGEPDDIAKAIVFLSSTASSYITGHTLVVDGGWILP